MRKAWWVVVCGTGLAMSLALAEPGTVVTKNNQSFEGEVKEDAEQVTVVRKGIETRIPRADIAVIRYASNNEDAIKADHAKLKPDDVAGRLVLARRAFDARQYTVARGIANEALGLDPNSAAAVQLLETIRRQVQLEARTAALAESRAGETPATPVAPATPTSKEAPVPTNAGNIPGDAIPRIYLDEQDINAIRQAELQPTIDTRVRIKFINNVGRRFAQQMQEDVGTFLRRSDIEKTQDILQRGDGALRKDVVVSDDPDTIKQFRSFQRQIVSGCAAANCHGTTAGGKFFLFTSTDSEAATYTNFYLLNRYSREVEGGTAGIFGSAGTSQRMIDRQRAERSLLLSYGLPIASSENPHPAIKGFRPLFTTPNDRLYQVVLNWIGNGMKRVEPKYDVKYVSPVDTRAATAPSTKPATPAAGGKPAAAVVPAGTPNPK